MAGEANRQAYLETALKWISSKEGKTIPDYMSEHQHDSNATESWLYFQNVINWVTTIFPKYRREMKGIEWGLLYNEFKDKSLNPSAIEEEIAELIQNDEVQSHKGVYEYVLTRKEKYLNLRSFSDAQKRRAYEKPGPRLPSNRKSFAQIDF